MHCLKITATLFALIVFFFAWISSSVSFADDTSKTSTAKTEKVAKPNGSIADPAVVGGESGSVIKVANLVYAGTKTSECFSDHFLRRAEESSSISTSRRLHSVKLASDEVYNFPMLIMNGEGEFTLLAQERDNLRRFIQRGGFLLASAGCSSKEWNQSFRRDDWVRTPRFSYRLRHRWTQCQARHSAATGRASFWYSTRSSLLPRRPQRYIQYARLLLLWRK
jgi:hypothetical protein